MLKLSGIPIRTHAEVGRKIFSITTNSDLPLPLKKQKAYLLRSGGEFIPGFLHYLVLGAMPTNFPPDQPYTLLDQQFDYLEQDDVVRVGDGRIRVLYRALSDSNSFLLTERCNNYCLMCSQPPKDIDDSWLLDEAMEAIRLLPASTKEIGITGGEPTLYGRRFIDLLHLAKSYHPQAAVHVLSNGRYFMDLDFCRAYAAVKHPDLMVGIPVYSADPSVHDYVVQAEGAFQETILGILNLKRMKQRVELRVVLHKQTIGGLVQLAEYIARNLLFVDQVALMGLEIMGFARANIHELWIDPADYRDTLSEAVEILRAYGIKTAVYNHPLCLINSDIEDVYVKSISDWKNEFAVECELCLRQQDCGGFFSSGIKYRYSSSLKPFKKTILSSSSDAAV
ncbi:His-Xaa-Ser system radical SAM maturase HxsC [Sphingomonas sp. NCPPB 2930]